MEKSASVSDYIEESKALTALQAADKMKEALQKLDRMTQELFDLIDLIIPSVPEDINKRFLDALKSVPEIQRNVVVSTLALERQLADTEIKLAELTAAAPRREWEKFWDGVVRGLVLDREGLALLPEGVKEEVDKAGVRLQAEHLTSQDDE